jgi:hypothetical protein
MAMDCLRRRIRYALMRDTPITSRPTPFELLHAVADGIIVTPKVATPQALMQVSRGASSEPCHGRPNRSTPCHSSGRRAVTRGCA